MNPISKPKRFGFSVEIIVQYLPSLVKGFFQKKQVGEYCTILCENVCILLHHCLAKDRRNSHYRVKNSCYESYNHSYQCGHQHGNPYICTALQFASAEQYNSPMFFASGKISWIMSACPSNGARSEVPEIFFPTIPVTCSDPLNHRF